MIMSNLITVKQMADRLNVSKGTINNHMNKNNLEYLQQDNVNYLTEQHQTIIEQSVSNTKQRYQSDAEQTNEQSLTNEQLSNIINTLMNQLNEKDKQINKLSELLEYQQELNRLQLDKVRQIDTTEDTDSDSGTVTHRHTDTTEDAQRGYNKGTDSAEDTTHVTSTNKSEDIEDGKEAVATDKDSKKHKRGFWDKLFGGK